MFSSNLWKKKEEMRLFNLCINEIAKPNVMKHHMDHLERLPYNVKTALFTILAKRGFVCNSHIAQTLVNPNLTIVDLSECVVSDDILNCLTVCKSLRKLDLSLRRRQSRFITTSVLASIFTYMPLLRVIAVPHCKEFTDEVVKAICETCFNLVELHVPNTLITDDGMKLIGACLKGLAVLNLLGNQISDVGMKHLIDGPIASTLTELNIDKCPDVTLSSCQLIDKHCQNITIFTCGVFSQVDGLNGIRNKAKQLFWSV